MKKIYVHFCNIAIHSNAIYNMTLTRIVYVLLNLFRCVAHTGEIMVQIRATCSICQLLFKCHKYVRILSDFPVQN